MKAQAKGKPLLDGMSIVHFGGGGGASAVAPALAEAVGKQGHLTIGVAMSDSGGSVRKYRQQAGGLGLSDYTSILAALATNLPAAAILHGKRFDQSATSTTVAAYNAALLKVLPKGSDRKTAAILLAEAIAVSNEIIAAHGDIATISYANITLAGMARRCPGGLIEAGTIMSHWLGLRPSVAVVPVTVEPHDLILCHDVNGRREIVRTESTIDATMIQNLRSVEVWLEGYNGITPHATDTIIAALRGAQAVTIGPGSLITSETAAILPKGIVETINERSIPVGLAANVEPERTMRHAPLEEYEEHLRRHGISPAFVVQDSTEPSVTFMPLRYRDTQLAQARVLAAHLVKGLAHHTADDSLAQAGQRSNWVTDGHAFVSAVAAAYGLNPVPQSYTA